MNTTAAPSCSVRCMNSFNSFDSTTTCGRFCNYNFLGRTCGTGSNYCTGDLVYTGYTCGSNNFNCAYEGYDDNRVLYYNCCVYTTLTTTDAPGYYCLSCSSRSN